MSLLIVVLGIALLLLPILPFKFSALLTVVDVAGPIPSRGPRWTASRDAGMCGRRRGDQEVSA